MRTAIWFAVLAISPGSSRADGIEPIARSEWAELAAVMGALAVAGLAVLLPQQARDLPPDAARAAIDGYGPASTIAAYGGALALVGLATVSRSSHDGGFGLGQLRAPAVVAESALWSLGLAQVAKRLVGRCRPSAWDDTRGRCDPDRQRGDDAHGAFWSGHAAVIAGAAAGSLCLGLRDRAGPMLAAGIAGELTAAATGALRILSGAHSASDVAAALAAGNAVGIGVCALHPAAGRAPQISLTRHALAVGWSF
jgi:membrane-associated phospholipid phosphatase